MRLLLLLSLFLNVAIAASVFIRQTDGTVDNTVDCATYSSIANLSTISSNSTYRSAFMASTTDGSSKAASILNTAQSQLPGLINDVLLNRQCGNATDLALTEAANNFTNGIIAEFRIQAPAGVSPRGGTGLITIMVVVFTVVLMCGTFSSL